MTQEKKDLDDWLNEVDYSHLNSAGYIPSKFALKFANFVKLVNGEVGESHQTPPFHLAMLDKLAGRGSFIANLCFRGAAKTTLMMEYLALYLGVFENLPGLGKVSGLIYVSDSMENGVKSARKNIEFRYNNSEFLRYWIPKATFTDNYIEFTNRDGHQLGIKMFGAKTGIRGTKIFGKRPTLAILDDLVSDEDANSAASMTAIKNTVYKGIIYALDPSCFRLILNGTPFNKNDILIEAVESGKWDVNVWPVCEKFPCTPEEFRGAWPDRFPYEYVLKQYELAMATGKGAAFMQELMLRITSEENRLVQDTEVRWYPRAKLLEKKHQYNFYITTDIAVSTRQRADRTVLAVWAYNANKDWFLVDAVVGRQFINKTWDQLFRLVGEYRPQQVGIEITGQQMAFINTLQKEMMDRNLWFNFASSAKTGEPGIRPITDKLSRFNLVVPLFKSGKIYFPSELRLTPEIGQFLMEIRLATSDGIKGSDDCLDTVSMLSYLKAWTPSDSVQESTGKDTLWDEPPTIEGSPLNNYIV